MLGRRRNFTSFPSQHLIRFICKIITTTCVILHIFTLCSKSIIYRLCSMQQAISVIFEHVLPYFILTLWSHEQYIWNIFSKFIHWTILVPCLIYFVLTSTRIFMMGLHIQWFKNSAIFKVRMDEDFLAKRQHIWMAYMKISYTYTELIFVTVVKLLHDKVRDF